RHSAGADVFEFEIQLVAGEPDEAPQPRVAVPCGLHAREFNRLLFGWSNQRVDSHAGRSVELGTELWTIRLRSATSLRGQFCLRPAERLSGERHPHISIRDAVFDRRFA